MSLDVYTLVLDLDVYMYNVVTVKELKLINTFYIGKSL